jgi:HJR/Mrr/RecB family endonuclease
MSNSDDPFERALLGMVSHIPGRIVAALALLLYPGAGLLLPLVLRWSLWGLVEANVLGTLFAAIVALGWLIVQLEARDRRHLVEWTTNLRLLNAEEFEWLVGELFRREGWNVAETGRRESADGNIDLVLTRGGLRRIVQCKRWSSWLVGVEEVREFAGTLMREGLRGSAGVFVTLSTFGEQARAEALALGLTIVDGRDLYRRVEKARRAEPCPACRAPMRLDRSPRGWWLHCVAPGSRGKRDLGDEPGRALELLTIAA